MLVNIYNDVLFNLLIERVHTWTKNIEVIKLYEKMYESYIDNNLFEYMEFDPMVIVDNDYINYCSTFHKDNILKKDYKILLEHIKDGNFDISEEKFSFGKPSFIEAVSDDKESFLIRW